MGLTLHSTGAAALDSGLEIKKHAEGDLVIALAGNPNVGKSTVFNALTGMHQHTGNWPGKTVASVQGYARSDGQGFVLVDIPGTYSLMAHSAEEEVARNFICFGETDAVAVVCDATCLERNLNLVLQIIEISPRTVVCVNLMDEAKRKGISIDLKLLSDRLGVPVLGMVARRKKTLSALLATLDRVAKAPRKHTIKVEYDTIVEQSVAYVEKALAGRALRRLNARFLALKLLDADPSFLRELDGYLGNNFLNETLSAALVEAREMLSESGFDTETLRDSIVTSLSQTAKAVVSGAVTYRDDPREGIDRKLDRLLTGKWTAYPLMILLLAGVLFITVIGANYPSEWLSKLFSLLGMWMRSALLYISAPPWLIGLLMDGIYLVLTSVISVMLPPMAIFFPLFTFLEDVGYLPRIAYNLDRPFCRCRACGKQSLTMCMGFGCNAAGVVGCRIIDSPRERLLAILTNTFAPCNGRFPTFIVVLTVFFAGSAVGAGATLRVALLLTALIVLGVLVTFAATKLLSATLLSGTPSSFTLELPPYRPPQVGKILIRSIFDRTLFVLGRAAVVAAPAGAILYALANIKAGDMTLLAHAAAFLDPFGQFLGLDGSILLGFILGFPANEIVLPIVLMIYLCDGVMSDLGSVAEIGNILVANGWTTVTAICFLFFSLMHWPCSTTVLTVKKETGSWGWTAVAVILPTLFGIAACAFVNGVANLFAFV
ncbi:MAG: ferrous iron transport protein B [Clostridia bacterium]|nr:ferrous iron transport protein B [Clostridia bacterium]